MNRRFSLTAATLVALMEIQASRIPARLDPDGLPVPRPEQNRGRRATC